MSPDNGLNVGYPLYQPKNTLHFLKNEPHKMGSHLVKVESKNKGCPYFMEIPLWDVKHPPRLPLACFNPYYSGITAVSR